MGRSTAPQAYIGMIVRPFFFTPPSRETEPMEGLPPAAASVYLAGHSVVFIGYWMPEDDPDALDEWEQNLFDKAGREGLRRIWPPTADIAWPTEDIP
jgi:hypothetical protein